jgi:hypothetical protein
VAGGLTARQLGQLLTEHGSWEAAIEARPDLADQLRAARAVSDQAARLAEQLRETAGQFRAVTEIREPEAIELESPRALELRLLGEIANKRDQPADEERPSPDLGGAPLPALAAWKALLLFFDGATVRRVEGETGLSYRKALRVRSWIMGRAVVWDRVRGRPEAAPGYRLVTSGQGASKRCG